MNLFGDKFHRHPTCSLVPVSHVMRPSFNQSPESQSSQSDSRGFGSSGLRALWGCPPSPLNQRFGCSLPGLKQPHSSHPQSGFLSFPSVLIQPFSQLPVVNHSSTLPQTTERCSLRMLFFLWESFNSAWSHLCICGQLADQMWARLSLVWSLCCNIWTDLALPHMVTHPSRG